MRDLFYEADKLHEECGVFGIYSHKDDVALNTYWGHAPQAPRSGKCGNYCQRRTERPCEKEYGPCFRCVQIRTRGS